MDTEPVKFLVARIRQALAEDARTNILDIQVAIRAGRVFLLGQVDSSARRSAAEEVTRELVPEDMAINNELWIPNYATPSETETLP